MTRREMGIGEPDLMRVRVTYDSTIGRLEVRFQLYARDSQESAKDLLLRLGRTCQQADASTSNTFGDLYYGRLEVGGALVLARTEDDSQFRGEYIYVYPGRDAEEPRLALRFGDRVHGGLLRRHHARGRGARLRARAGVCPRALADSSTSPRCAGRSGRSRPAGRSWSARRRRPARCPGAPRHRHGRPAGCPQHREAPVGLGATAGQVHARTGVLPAFRTGRCEGQLAAIRRQSALWLRRVSHGHR